MLILDEKFNPDGGYTVRNNLLMEHGQPKLVEGLPVRVIFTRQ